MSSCGKINNVCIVSSPVPVEFGSSSDSGIQPAEKHCKMRQRKISLDSGIYRERTAQHVGSAVSEDNIGTQLWRGLIVARNCYYELPETLRT